MTATRDRAVAAIVPLADNGAALQPVAGEPPLLRVVRGLLGAVSDPADVVVVSADRLIGDAAKLLGSLGPVSTAVAGVMRAQCLHAGLQHLARRRDPPPFVLVHDVCQPMASAEVCDRLADRLRAGDPIVLPVLPVTDSVKAVDDNGSVAATVDRASLRAVQYPRGFAVGQLTALLERAAEDSFDEVREALRASARVTTVEGDAEVFVADLSRDIRFVKAVIASRS